MREVQVALRRRHACQRLVGLFRDTLSFGDETGRPLTRKMVRPADLPAPVEATNSAGDCFSNAHTQSFASSALSLSP